MKKSYHGDMEGAEILIKKMVGTRYDDKGRIIKVFKWEKLDSPISLGSMKKPKNTDFLGFKVIEKKKPMNVQDMLGGIFGGG